MPPLARPSLEMLPPSCHPSTRPSHGMKLTPEGLATFSNAFCMSVTLLINFSLFQYLTTVYYTRRREPRGALLLACAFGGFATLIPFSIPNKVMVGHLNDISETLSVLTFLFQITILGRDINKKVKISTLKYLTLTSELLIVFGPVVVVQSLVEVLYPPFDAVDGLDNIMKDVELWFIFVFRFAMLVMAKGYRFVLEHKKTEIVLYLLFATHEYPFQVLAAHSNVSWENVQALWNRLTIALCVGMTVQEKLRSNSSKLASKLTTNMSTGPSALRALAPTTAAISAGRTTRSSWRGFSSKLSMRSPVRPAVAVSVAPQKKG